LTRLKNTPLPNVGFRFARILLILSLAFLPYLAIGDFQHGHVLAGYAKCVVVLVCGVGYYLSKNENNHYIVRFGVASSLFLMASIGAVSKLDSFYGLVWAPVLPLLFCFLIGIRYGITYTLFYLIVFSGSYFSFEYFNNIPAIDIGLWSQTVVAYLFVLVVTVLFQKETQKDEKHLKNVAKFDFLTQLLNRRGFVPRMEEEVSRVSRYGGNLSIIIGDIDNFKFVNDQYGHSAGDTLLVEFSDLLLQHTRSSDVVARWGGEEFIILAPNTDLNACTELAEKLRLCISKNEFSVGNRITSSFGVTQYLASESQDVFLNRADGYLFEAKQFGKNRVVNKPPIIDRSDVIPPVAVA